MDPFEKLLQQETDTDEKHSAAADFFMGLKKVAKVMPTHGKKRKQSIKSQALASSKLLQSRSGAKAIKLPVQTAKVKVTPASLPGQAQAAAQTKSIKYKDVSSASKVPSKEIKLLAELRKKPVKSKKLKTASTDDKKLVLTEAFVMRKQAFAPITGLSRLARSAVNAGRRAGSTAEAIATGAKHALTPGPSRWQMMGESLKRGAGKLLPGPVVSVGKAVGKTVRSGKRGVQNFWNPDLARARASAQKHVTEYLTKAGPKPTSPGDALDIWEKGYARAVGKKRATMMTYRTLSKAGDVSGLKSTGSQIFSAIKDPSGKISPSSIYSGLEGLGLASPEALAGLGSTAYSTMKAAKGTREAARTRNQMMMLGGGGAGLAAIALLKNKKRDRSSIPVHMAE